MKKVRQPHGEHMFVTHRIGLMSTVHGYRLYQQGHVTKRSCPTVPSGPLLLTTSLSSGQKSLRLLKKDYSKKRVRNKRNLKSKFKKKWGIKEE